MFVRKYIEAYKNAETLPPIVAEFREGTSYELIKDTSRLNKFLEKYGLRARVIEDEGIERRGKERMHHARIDISRI